MNDKKKPSTNRTNTVSTGKLPSFLRNWFALLARGTSASSDDVLASRAKHTDAKRKGKKS